MFPHIMAILIRIERHLGIQVIFLKKTFNFKKQLNWVYYNVNDPYFEHKLVTALYSHGLYDGRVKLAVGFFVPHTNCIPLAIIKP